LKLIITILLFKIFVQVAYYVANTCGELAYVSQQYKKGFRDEN